MWVTGQLTAKTMMKIAGDEKIWSLPSAELAEKLGYADTSTEYTEVVKTASASVEEETFKLAFLGKSAKQKKSEIVKDTIPSQFTSKAVPVVTKEEPNLPNKLLDMLGSRPLSEALATLTGMGITLRPKEFQRIVIVSTGNRPLADDLDRRSIVFPHEDSSFSGSLMGEDGMNPAIADLLLPFLENRSVFGPPIERRSVRILMQVRKPEEENKVKHSSLSSDLLRKIGAAYTTYRNELMSKVAEAQDMITNSGISDRELTSLAQLPVDALFTPMSAAHLKLAYWSELGSPGNGTALSANVERAIPSKNTFNKNVHF